MGVQGRGKRKKIAIIGERMIYKELQIIWKVKQKVKSRSKKGRTVEVHIEKKRAKIDDERRRWNEKEGKLKKMEREVKKE